MNQNKRKHDTKLDPEEQKRKTQQHIHNKRSNIDERKKENIRQKQRKKNKRRSDQDFANREKENKTIGVHCKMYVRLKYEKIIYSYMCEIISLIHENIYTEDQALPYILSFFKNRSVFSFLLSDIIDF